MTCVRDVWCLLCVDVYVYMYATSKSATVSSWCEYEDFEYSEYHTSAAVANARSFAFSGIVLAETDAACWVFSRALRRLGIARLGWRCQQILPS